MQYAAAFGKGIAFAEGRRVLHEDGVGSVIFAHKTTEGWEALVSGLIQAGWTVTGSWPIATERLGRPRSYNSAALETSVHLICRPRADDADMARILTEEHAAGAYACVMHCFSSGAELARAALDLGFYLSMSGIAAFPKSTALRDIFAAAPVERILVETDAPYLAPPPFRGKRNEPAHAVHTARVGAGLFGLSEAAFAAQTCENFDRLFRKAAAWAGAA